MPHGSHTATLIAVRSAEDGATGDPETARGAYDTIAKPIDQRELFQSIGRLTGVSPPDAGRKPSRATDPVEENDRPSANDAAQLNDILGDVGDLLDGTGG